MTYQTLRAPKLWAGGSSRKSALFEDADYLAASMRNSLRSVGFSKGRSAFAAWIMRRAVRAQAVGRHVAMTAEAIAADLKVSETTAKRLVRWGRSEGWLDVVENSQGGRGQIRRIAVNIKGLISFVRTEKYGFSDKLERRICGFLNALERTIAKVLNRLKKGGHKGGQNALPYIESNIGTSHLGSETAPSTAPSSLTELAISRITPRPSFLPPGFWRRVGGKSYA